MIKEVQKTQIARLNSLLIFCPIMIYFATKNELSRNERILATVVGVGTFVTVYYAWNENRKKIAALEQEQNDSRGEI